MKTNKLNIKTVSIKSVKPYWRNPRINDSAVPALKESIEKYGYVQPILVDKDFVIIAGHTRYKALVQLGYTDIDIIVADLDEKKAKEYRIVDNKTNTLAVWDNAALFQEIGEIGESIIGFSEKELEAIIGAPLNLKDVTEEEVMDTAVDIASSYDSNGTEHASISLNQDADDELDFSQYNDGGQQETPLAPSAKPLMIDFQCPDCGATITMSYNDLVAQFQAIRRREKQMQS